MKYLHQMFHKQLLKYLQTKYQFPNTKQTLPVAYTFQMSKQVAKMAKKTAARPQFQQQADATECHTKYG